MILIDNVKTLKQSFPIVWEIMRLVESESGDEMTHVIESRSGLPTVAIKHNEQLQYIHSQYDPRHEAKRFVNQFKADEVSEYGHVFFYGVGLGYHIEEFLARFPQLPFTIYEPNPNIFYEFVSQRKLSDFPLTNLKQVYVEHNSINTNYYLNDFSSSIKDRVLFTTLPSYERVFESQYKNFVKNFIDVLIDKRSSINTDIAFEKLWTINSLINLVQTVKTPNILHDFDQTVFKDKPAILVAAGPSLEDEIENLRYIKENRLAYIFAAGTGVRGLVTNNIYPNAVLSYDPSSLTQFTLSELMNSNEPAVPLIYGSSIGFETVHKYPGNKIHMITTQDTVTPFYCTRQDSSSLQQIQDAPSIAVVTLELLYRLGCNPIILVGQNFAYRDNQYYSKGIHFDWDNKLNAAVSINTKNKMMVEDVYGGTVYTDLSFNFMRNAMEKYIRQFSDCQFLNATKGGAKIEGTLFIELEKIIEEHLLEPVVNENWLPECTQSLYEPQYWSEKIQAMESGSKQLEVLLNESIHQLKTLKSNANVWDYKRMESFFDKFDKLVKKILKNDFYCVFLKPMNRVQFDFLQRVINEIRFEKNPSLKAQKTSDFFGGFIYHIYDDFKFMIPIVAKVHREILELPHKNDSECGGTYEK